MQPAWQGTVFQREPGLMRPSLNVQKKHKTRPECRMGFVLLKDTCLPTGRLFQTSGAPA